MKLFSPENANALIPVLAPLIEELWSKRRELAIRLLENDPALRARRRAGSPAPAMEIQLTPLAAKPGRSSSWLRPTTTRWDCASVAMT